MSLKGQTVFVLIIEGQYPGNASIPEVFASEEDANTRKVELEAARPEHPTRQVFWCEVEEMTIE